MDFPYNSVWSLGCLANAVDFFDWDRHRPPGPGWVFRWFDTFTLEVGTGGSTGANVPKRSKIECLFKSFINGRWSRSFCHICGRPVDGNTPNACQGLYHLKRLRVTKARDTCAKSMVNITHIESNNSLNHPKPIITPHLGLVAAMRSDAALCDLQCVCGYWQFLRQWGVDRFLEAGGLGEVSAAGGGMLVPL